MSEKPVVVTTDGSPHSLRVLPHAARFAGARNTGLMLLRVLERGDVVKEPGEADEAARERARARVQLEIGSMLERSGIEGETLVEPAAENERTADVLLRVAATSELMAIDSRGRGFVANLLHGSVAREVLSRSESPLMMSGPALLGPAAGDEMYRILATTDCSDASKQVLRAIAPLMEPGRFKLTLLHVHEHAPGGQDDEAEVRQKQIELGIIRGLLPAALDVEVMMRPIPRGGGIDTAILEEASSVRADAIAISTHGQGGRRSLLMGSVAMSVLGRSPLPLILARV